MDAAIITGADTFLGLEIAKHLVLQGYHVHGIGNNFSNLHWADDAFTAHAIDLTDMDSVGKTARNILEKENRADLLVHALDVTPGAAFENLPIGNLEAILKVGLLGPVLLTRTFLPNLLRCRGQLIHVIPTNKNGHKQSAINALILGGLREMNLALLDPCRDQGLRVTNIIIHTNEHHPESAKASAEQLQQSQINPTGVLRSIEELLKPHATNIPSEITIYPQLSPQATKELAEAPLPIDPYKRITLPPKEYYPPEPESIPTQTIEKVQRVIPYSDEEIQERITSAIEDFDARPGRHKAKNMSARGGKKKSSQKINRQQKKAAEKQEERSKDLRANHNRKNIKPARNLSEKDSKKETNKMVVSNKILPAKATGSIAIKPAKKSSEKSINPAQKKSNPRKVAKRKTAKKSMSTKQVVNKKSKSNPHKKIS